MIKQRQYSRETITTTLTVSDCNRMSELDELSQLKNVIPADLLPVQRSKYTVEWGHSTFKHAYKFSNKFISVAYTNDTEVRE